MSDVEPILEVKNLWKSFKLSTGEVVQALRDVSFKVYPGEIVGIIGRSGAGKTTLLRILRGVESFDGGVVRIAGTTLTPKSSFREIQEVRDKTAIHLQRSFALWAETTKENLMLRLMALETGDETAGLPPEDDPDYKRYEEEAMRLLKLVGLEHKAEQAALTLSGGEKQRLILARQLAARPKVLLLDEPLTMVAPEQKRENIEVIRRIHRELGMTTLLVSHMPHIHEELSERLIWLDEGRIRKEGDVREIIDEFLGELEPPAPLPPLKEKKPLFKLEKVGKRYYHYTLKKLFEITNVDLVVHRGEILGVIGPSGVGKTVLMRILAGIELPNEGRVLYYEDGRQIDLTHLGIRSALVRRNIGILHQEFGLTHHAKVEDIIKGRKKFKELTEEDMKKLMERFELTETQLDFVLRLADMPSGVRSEILDELEISEDEILEIYAAIPQVDLDINEVLSIFEFMGLTPKILGRRAYELSGGEKIRVALAVELAAHPSLLILDEPFGDLDPITARKVSNIIKNINKTYGTSFAIVSHDRELLASTTHRIVLIKEGVLREDVSEEELRNI
ncbi:MAG TPA: ABC transporter ATP-binding protein [Methanomicrobia archaeon]|nr:ABC transporter ATP-binding protein [Methanomicrobia archaeon]HEX59549.1 ABC transporter ATP-binding protein [Methanomicrobia archaeon]